MGHPDPGFDGRDLGAMLRQARRNRGWSLADAADASQRRFKPSTLAAYERTERRISVEVLGELAQLYDVPVGWFFPPDGDGLRAEVAERISHLPGSDRRLVVQLVERMLRDRPAHQPPDTPPAGETS